MIVAASLCSITKPEYMKTVSLLTLCVLLLYTGAFTQTKPSGIRTAAWLQVRLESYFQDRITMKELATRRYARFKTDIMHSEFDHGMSPSALEAKWGRSYTCRRSYLPGGFLIPLQDWNRVTVRCRFFTARGGSIWVTALFTESGSKESYSRYIKLIKENGSYRIDDVWETESAQEIVGDYNGDGLADTLTVHFTSLVDGQSILVDTTMEYDRMIAAVVHKKPLLQLLAPGLRALVLNRGQFYVLGLEYGANIGNVNRLSGDELAVVIRGADWSAINRILVFTYKKDGWSRIGEQEIREEVLPQLHSGEIKPTI